MSTISVVIPCLNEEKYIANCIESIVGSDIDYNNTEVIFVDGDSYDKTVDIINSYREKYSFIQVVINPKKYTPISMNIGINASSGSYIFILSAHAKYEVDYFKKLVYYIKELNAECVGGILYTDVKNKSKKSNSIKEVLTHRFGVGNASFRTGSSKIKLVDTVAFGCYTKDIFDKIGLFNEQLIRNQDIELNKRIINSGKKIYLIPKVQATYYARENFIDLAKNNYANGYWNVLTAYYTKTLNSLSLRHFIPLLFILSLLLPFVFSLILPKLLWITFFSLSNYITFVIIVSLKLKKKTNSFMYLMQSFITLHFSYGLGSLVGIFSVIKKSFSKEKDNGSDRLSGK